MPACPVNAISKRTADNIVFIDRAKCVGCANCVAKCPYKAVHIDNSGKASKCELCLDRRAAGETTPYCVKTCPTQARKFVDLETPGVTNGYTRQGSAGGATPNVYYTDDILL
jgi:Fe-S-cluster-containing dehydrogenase component